MSVAARKFLDLLVERTAYLVAADKEQRI